MDPSMKLGQGIPIAARSNSLELDIGNLQELAGFPIGSLQQQMPNSGSVAPHLGQLSGNGMINQIAGSYAQAMRNNGLIQNTGLSSADLSAMMNGGAQFSYPNRGVNRSVNMSNTNTPFRSMLNSQLNSPAEFLFANQFPFLNTHNNNSYQLPQCPVPRNNYNLNSVPCIEAATTSAVPNSYQFAPSTPQQPKRLNQNQLSATVNFPYRNLHDSVITMENVPKEKSCNEIVDSSSAVISAPLEEPKDSEKGSDQVFDLNQTPEQKPPKRKKHRPKVIVEGKPKRTPKAAADPNKATGKRKYVRKNQHESVNRQPDSVGETAGSEKKPKEKRKYTRKNSVAEPETQKANCMGEATDFSSRMAAPSCRRALIFDSPGTTGVDLGIGQIPFPAKTNCRSLEGPGQIMPQNTPQSIPKISHLTESRGHKRDSCHAEQKGHYTASTTNKLLCQETSHTDYRLYEMSGTVCSERHKKKKVENEIPANRSSFPPSVTAINHSGSTTSSNNATPISSSSQRNSEILNSYPPKRIENTGSKVGDNFFSQLLASTLGLSLPMQQLLPAQNLGIERIEEANKSTKVQNLSTLATIRNMLPQTPTITTPQPRNHQQLKVHNAKLSGKQETGPSETVSVPSRRLRKLQEQTEVAKDPQLPAKRRGRPVKQKLPATVEEIICRMEGLSLNEKGNREQKALVPYNGGNTLVLYQDPTKKKVKPKVDLDPETERVWRLLMWERTEDPEGTDEEKQRWWEEERRVFRGRADSFIARMHLVQGDRRFSKWKGSVVDSVIGVFLTQNVSDHLSSSAFMSLAAKFPLEETRNINCKSDGKRVLVDEPDACMPNPNGTIKWHENSSCNQFYNQISIASCESTENQRDCETSWTERISIIEAPSHSPEEVLSSQDSFDSSVIQSGGVRSYSSSNTEADPANGSNHSKKIRTFSTNLPPIEHTTLFEEFYSRVTGRSLLDEKPRHGCKEPEDLETSQQRQRSESLDGRMKGSSAVHPQLNYTHSQMQIPQIPSSNCRLYRSAQSEVVDVESAELCGDESISSWPSSVSRFSEEKDASCTSKTVAQGTEDIAKNTAKQSSSVTVRHQETPIVDPHAFLSKQVMWQQCSAGPCHDSQVHKINMTLQLDSISTAKPATLYDSQPQPNQQSSYKQHISNVTGHTGKVFDIEERITSSDKQRHSEHKIIESNLEQAHFTKKANLSANLKTKKANSESKKQDAIDWDSLRKEAQAKSKTKERRQDTMDSLDYEAMRRVGAHVIADAIKERGMNNMLANRIQDFLNRMVQEHGSIDLEWLRDVPPDKAKDYLLSIRGLGLKSVECVRLLTLHHLAFPVDTNVGRIAVRLGWVPLQPLPESLQLHLLELYPILESIQKYLWPRLCKLDQRTLYELHYQMITFGKVFCTKSRPNCNACPMRAECRHFASAFASARLALPGPGDKSLVTSTVPITTEKSPGIVIDPMPLPPPEEMSLSKGGSNTVICVPIIEEPATPEQEPIEVIESDIEDILYEDPNEIPTIKLNMEELTENIQNYMQANMELQECDMSKALVALNPEAASIPTPKLKNISKLRTEHQVYELPDSHPLLKGMDKRERDDPSPYLLAIWTPGETANTIQPPDQHCHTGESDKLCNDKSCFSCNSIREANSQTVRGTILIPCRTAMRGSFPLNGTYFQVNEVFADHESSLNPIDVPRAWIWNLPRRLVYFGTSVSSIFRGLSTEGIQYCFWKGFVCVRGFDQKTRAPKPLVARLHFPASKLAKTRNQGQ